MATASPTELLRNELEQRFDLDALHRLSRDLFPRSRPDVLRLAPPRRPSRGPRRPLRPRRPQEALADAIALTDRAAEPALRPVLRGAARLHDFSPGAVVRGPEGHPGAMHDGASARCTRRPVLRGAR